jgi:hypothetical protein
VHVVATFDSPVRAMQAVAYLRGVGLRARATTVSGSIVPAVHVLVPTSREADKAKAELNKFASPADLAAAVLGKTEDDQWERQALPDLSKLPGYLAPPCPGCGRPLPLDSRVTACPKCAAPVDVPALIVKYHGPEKLAQCYDPALFGSDAQLTFEEPCTCGYDLHGLPRQGVCPECGASYTKRGVDEW